MALALIVALLVGCVVTAVFAGLAFDARQLPRGFFFIAVGVLMLLAASKVPV